MKGFRAESCEFGCRGVCVFMSLGLGFLPQRTSYRAHLGSDASFTLCSRSNQEEDLLIPSDDVIRVDL